MKDALIKNNLSTPFLLLFLILFIYSCRNDINNQHLNRESLKLSNFDKMPPPDSISPLFIEISFDSFTSKKTYPLYEEEWDNYKFDYYYLKLNLINHDSYLFKIPLAVRKMPILFQIGENNDGTIYLNEVQLHNTVWNDSIVFNKIVKGNYYPFEAYQIGSYHNGIDVICPMDIIFNKDTIDITSIKKNNRCYERERPSI